MRFAPPKVGPLAVCLSICSLAAAAGSALSPVAHGSELRRTAIVKAIEDAAPSVVNIHGRKTVRAETDVGGSDHFRQVNGMGTGVVIDERGYIVTNYHVVEGVARIQVTLSDKRSTVARVIAHDPKTDLAIIKIDSEKKLPVIKIGTSSDLMTGEPVVAVGNAYGYEHTVTRGIVSALHRTVQVSDEQKYHDLIQTDASINPGNSGGPLLNIDG
jgi:serine protease Do